MVLYFFNFDSAFCKLIAPKCSIHEDPILTRLAQELDYENPVAEKKEMKNELTERYSKTSVVHRMNLGPLTSEFIKNNIDNDDNGKERASDSDDGGGGKSQQTREENEMWREISTNVSLMDDGNPWVDVDDISEEFLQDPKQNRKKSFESKSSESLSHSESRRQSSSISKDFDSEKGKKMSKENSRSFNGNKQEVEMNDADAVTRLVTCFSDWFGRMTTIGDNKAQNETEQPNSAEQSKFTASEFY